jgi:hypothetical protein
VTGLAQDIKQKIVLEGEKEYNAAIKEAQRNLKTLKSELKAETAELGKNATAQQKAEVKAKSLQKQIAEQEKIVKANKAALEEAKKEYGDNAEVVAKWEQKLNESRATLANMKNSIDDVGTSFKKVDGDAQLGVVATKSFADALKSVGDAAGGIADSLESAFTSVLGTITNAISELWGQVIEVSAKANAWTDLADYFGSTASEVQKWSNAIQGAGGSFGDFTTILNKFKTGGVNKKISDYFGVSDVNYKDDLEYTAAVLDAMYKKREKMEAAGTWDTALKDIFGGKKSQAAGWFISNWGTIQGNLNRYDAVNGGIGMSDEELSTMNQLYIDVQNILTTWQAFKESFLAGAFGKLSLDLVGNAQGILDGLIAFMSADNDADRNAAIQQIEENMTSFFTRLGEAIEAAAEALNKVGTDLAGSENGYVAMIGKVLQTLSTVLDSLSDPETLEKVKSFFEGIIGLWAGAKVASALGNIASFAANMKILGLMGGASAATSAASAGSAVGASWGGAFASAVMKASPFLVFLYELLNPAAGSDKLGDNTLVDKNGNLTQEAQEYGLALDENGDLYDTRKTPTENQKYTDYQLQKIQDFWDKYRNGEISSKDIFENFRTETLLNDNEFKELMTTLNTYIHENSNWREIEDLPADWWIGGGKENGLTSDDISSFRTLPGNIRSAVRDGVSGIRVNLDGQTVGSLVAGYVSEYIARDID